MFKSILLVLLLVLNQTVWSDCPETIQVITKGEIAPCDGTLLSPEATKKVDEAIQDAKYYKNLSEKLFFRQENTNKEINILDQRLKLYIDQSQILAQQVINKDNEDKWQKIVYFGLGVLATGIAIYGAAQFSR